MAIPGQEQINVSNVENQAFDSDSLFTAFHKVQNNFTTLFNSASPYTNIRAGSGITANADAANSTITITNTGVTSLVAGTGVTLANANGAYTISAFGGNGAAGITSIELRSLNTLSITSNTSTNPIVSNGKFTIDLKTLPITNDFAPGKYSTPDITVDQYGRISAISSNGSSGTVTSVNIEAEPGSGLSVRGGEITTTGKFYIYNEGVKSITAGTGINLTGNTGDVTISAVQSDATVSRIEITSSTLNITGDSIITRTGNVNIEIPEDYTFPGNLVIGNINSTHVSIGNGIVSTTSNLSVGNNITASGGITVDHDGIIKGNLTVLSLVVGGIGGGDANVVNLTATGNVKGANGNITANLVVGANANVTGNLNVTANANITGNIKGANANITANLVVGANANITGNLNVTANANVTGNINLSGNIVTSNNITANNMTANTYLNIMGGALYYSDNGKYIGLTALGGVSANYVFALPSAEGTANSFLSTNGVDGTLSFKQPASSSAPSTTSSTGVAGQIAYDGSYIYVCVGTNSWKRASLSTW